MLVKLNARIFQRFVEKMKDLLKSDKNNWYFM